MIGLERSTWWNPIYTKLLGFGWELVLALQLNVILESRLPKSGWGHLVTKGVGRVGRGSCKNEAKVLRRAEVSQKMENLGPSDVT